MRLRDLLVALRALPTGPSGLRRVPNALAALAGLALAGCPTPSPVADAALRDAFTPTRVSDPLSMPLEPTLRSADVQGASTCLGCHADHVAEWRTSAHAYAMVDPVFRALVAQRQVDRAGLEDPFCVQCHSPVASRAGESVPGFAFDELSSRALEGVTCVVCHQATELERDHNAGFVLDPTSPMRASLDAPTPTSAHASTAGSLQSSSELCASCHDVVELSGLNLERPYEEWLTSPAGAEGRTCQRCHMPTHEGTVAPGGPSRDVHAHRFQGVDVPLAEGFLDEAERAEVEAGVDALLRDVVSVELDAPTTVEAGETIDLRATVRSLLDAHGLPTGTTFIRQLWLELVVRDAEGRVVYETGTLDAQGDLRDAWSSLDRYGDHDLVSFSSSLQNAAGEPELFPWRATEHFRRSLEPLHARTSTHFVATMSSTMGPLSVDARIRFRSHPPYLLRALGLSALVEQVAIRDLATAHATIEVTP